MLQPLDILKRYFGYDEFRPNQGQIVDAILAGRDVLAIMPTGAGKSICYQVPALALDGWTLVVSPLISLMKDQVNALEQAGVSAGFVNSMLSVPAQMQVLDAVAAGVVRLLYVAPERLGAPEFERLCQEHPPALVAVDEAHCISRWGQDFRPSYMGIAGFVSGLPQRPVVAAFTATATRRVREDIAAALGTVRAVPGRAEVLDTHTTYKVILDYSHSPDALENILNTVREFTRGRVIALFGCGGDRDHIKRPIMGEIGGKLADYCVLTSDNPRTEDPYEILAAVEKGVKHTQTPYSVIENRREAIRFALEMARDGDVIVLAGKGHETYQEINGVKRPFDEKVVVAELLKEMRKDA